MSRAALFLAPALLGCGPEADTPPWGDDRVGFFAVGGSFAFVELPGGTRSSSSAISSLPDPAWGWTLDAQSIAYQHSNGFAGHDLANDAPHGQFIASSHCAPPSLLAIDGSTALLAIVELDCAQEGQFVSVFDFDEGRGQPWSRTTLFESPGEISELHWASDAPALALVHAPTPTTQEVVQLAPDGTTAVRVPATSEPVRLPRLTPDGRGLAVVVGDVVRVDGAELLVDAMDMDWRPGTDELWVLGSDGALWQTSVSGDARIVFSLTNVATWIGWSHDGEHWAVAEECDDEGSRLIVDGDALVECSYIGQARWSNQQAILAFEAHTERPGPALRLVDLGGNTLVVEDARSPHFGP